MNLPILSLTIISPLLGILVILLLPKRKEKEIKSVSLLIVSFVFLLSLFILTNFDYHNSNMQFVEKYTWIKSAGIDYHLGLDGISLPIFFLTALITLLCVIYSWNITTRVKAYFILLLLLETGALGLFVSLDFILFYIFWEWVLIPMYFLISIWGKDRLGDGPKKEYVALKFLLYTLFGSVIMLIGILGMHFSAKEVNTSLNTFNILKLTQYKYPLNLQIIFFLALFIGFAFKVPIFPFHSWLPDAYTAAPTAGSVFLSAVLSKMGIYGFIRISLPILPEATRLLATPLAILGVSNIVYGAFIALAQKDLKRLIAYSSLSHLGYIILGIAAGTVSSLNGAVLGMFNHGIIIGILFLLNGMFEERMQAGEIRKEVITSFDGLSRRIPLLSGILTYACLASLGLPGLNNFINEFLVLLGIFQSTWLSRIFILLVFPGMVLTIIYFLRLIIRLNFYPSPLGKIASSEVVTNPLKLTNRELIVLIPLVIVILILGIYPILILKYINPTVISLLEITNLK